MLGLGTIPSLACYLQFLGLSFTEAVFLFLGRLCLLASLVLDQGQPESYLCCWPMCCAEGLAHRLVMSYLRS